MAGCVALSLLAHSAAQADGYECGADNGSSTCKGCGWRCWPATSWTTAAACARRASWATLRCRLPSPPLWAGRRCQASWTAGTRRTATRGTRRRAGAAYGEHTIMYETFNVLAMYVAIHAFSLYVSDPAPSKAPEEHHVLIQTPLMYEICIVPAVYVAIQAVLALYAYIVPSYEGCLASRHFDCALLYCILRMYLSRASLPWT
mmetsp:Transcript_33709/g.101491  ORF Transcript_33709/g.101491 Transcript_33709/m.101491 type:complete len:203 (+) Transcript_33709:128-736(+)